MIAEIVPLIRLPRSEGIFDFRVPPELSITPGMIVRIPFGRRQLFGLVWKLKKNETTKYKLRDVESRYEQFPPLPPSYLKMIKDLSEHYAVSKSVIALLCVPDLLRRKNVEPRKLPARAPQKVTLDPKIKTFLRSRSNQLILTHHPSYLHTIAKLITATASEGQHVVIVPDFQRLQSLYDALPPTVKRSTVLIHSKLSTGALQQAWLTAIENQSAVVLGTRRALFVPLPQLATIWLIDEDDPSHKQYDLNPRFDTGTVAEALAAHQHIKIYRTSLTPTLATWDTFRRHRTRVLRLGTFSPIDYVSSTQHGMVFPPIVEERIQTALAQQQRVCIITQQRSEASSLHCAHCGYVFRCPACQSIIGRESAQELKCKRCATTLAEPRQCPRCKSTQLRDAGLTPKRIATMLRSLFPDASITDHSSTKSIDTKAHITIGTEQLLSTGQFFDLAIVASLEQLLARPSFEVEFRAWQICMRLRNSAAKTIIIGKDESTPLLQALHSPSWNQWYESLWKLRTQWHYPPAWTVLKLMYRNTDGTEAKNESQKKASQLRNQIGTTAEVVGPFPRYPFRAAGTYRYAVLLRWHDTPPDLGFLKDKSWDEWQVDVNPLDAS